jgi:tetratricopeptide (TPR) repeat protein
MDQAAIAHIFTTGKWEEGILLLSEMVQKFPTNAKLHATLGQCHLNLHRYREALPCFQRACALDPNLIEAGARLAICYEQLGKTEEAFRVTQEFLKRDPNHNYLRGIEERLKFRVTGGRKEEWEQTRGLDRHIEITPHE